MRRAQGRKDKIVDSVGQREGQLRMTLQVTLSLGPRNPLPLRSASPLKAEPVPSCCKTRSSPQETVVTDTLGVHGVILLI